MNFAAIFGGGSSSGGGSYDMDSNLFDTLGSQLEQRLMTTLFNSPSKPSRDGMYDGAVHMDGMVPLESDGIVSPLPDSMPLAGGETSKQPTAGIDLLKAPVSPGHDRSSSSPSEELNEAFRREAQDGLLGLGLASPGPGALIGGEAALPGAPFLEPIKPEQPAGNQRRPPSVAALADSAPAPKPAPKPAATAKGGGADKKRRRRHIRGAYKCSMCGLPKKNHVCKFAGTQRAAKKRKSAGVQMVSVGTQAAIDPHMTIQYLRNEEKMRLKLEEEALKAEAEAPAAAAAAAAASAQFFDMAARARSPQPVGVPAPVGKLAAAPGGRTRQAGFPKVLTARAGFVGAPGAFAGARRVRV